MLTPEEHELRLSLGETKELWDRPCHLPDASFNAIVAWAAKKIHQARREALEEAAQCVEKYETLKFWDQLRYKMEDAAPSVARSIRALMEKTE